MADNDVPDSTDWLQTPLAGLTAVEASLRCQVCKDFFRTPMITTCSHTFCSLCIRRALASDGKCPLCRANDQELKLRSNWSMEETVDAFVKSRSGILSAAKGIAETASKRKAEDDVSVRGEEAEGNKRLRTSARLSRNRTEPRSRSPVKEEAAVLEVADSDPDDDSYTPETHTDGLVACPVCNKKMKEWQVFRHLESCTGPASSPPQSESLPWSLPSHRQNPAKVVERLPAINYSMLKDAALRKKLSDLGISAQGPRTLLEKRHKEWITLWNANCDAAKPKKRGEILQDLEIWERTQGGKASIPGRLQHNAVVVKDKDFDGKAWAAKHEDSFKDLIENARNSRKQAQQVSNDHESKVPEQGDGSGASLSLNGEEQRGGQQIGGTELRSGAYSGMPANHTVQEGFENSFRSIADAEQ